MLDTLFSHPLHLCLTPNEGNKIPRQYKTTYTSRLRMFQFQHCSAADEDTNNSDLKQSFLEIEICSSLTRALLDNSELVRRLQRKKFFELV